MESRPDLHIITPETDHTAHYIWGLARNFWLNNDELNDQIYEATQHTFSEDRVLLELQDQGMQIEGMPQLPVKLDKAPVQGLKLLDAMIQA